jgi:dihydrofolate synthase/folylpolyglutamate synthase
VFAQLLRTRTAAPRALVLGMLADKPVEAVGRVLADVSERIFVIGLAGSRGLSADALQMRLRDAGVTAQTCDNMAAALRSARAYAGATGSVAVTGSFLTVAAAINELDAHE